MTCTRCGAALAPDSPDQLCPRCLLQAALASDAPPTALHAGAFAAPSAGDLQHLFPSLEVLELLGKGGMGAVYKAKQVALDRLVALKILPAGDDPAFAERFVREARALARLNHPNIVAVHDFGRSGNQVYFIMEFVDGVNLRQAMRAGELGPAEALKIVPQICDALQFAHDEGIVHRDIKPENILIDKKGRVKIADFGLAKLLGVDAPDTSLTGTRQGMGTLHYMAPEQLEAARSVDHRADIYSLGVTFYEMLTGELPLGRFAAPSQKAAVDARLDQVVFRSLEKEPGNRYQHASEVKSEVETISRTPPPAASSASENTWVNVPGDAVQTRLPVSEPPPTSLDSDPFRLAHSAPPPSVWMKVPWIGRFVAKVVLTLAVLPLFILFATFTAQRDGINGLEIIRFGAPDPWFEWTSRNNGFDFVIHPLSGSAAAFVAAGICFWLLLVIDRIERRAKHATLAAAITAESREIGGYWLACGIAYLISAVGLIVLLGSAEAALAEKLRDGQNAGKWDLMRLALITMIVSGFVVGVLQLAASSRFAKLLDTPLQRIAAIASIVAPAVPWFGGLMMGIWSLRFLNRPEARAALQTADGETESARAVARRAAAERAAELAKAPGWAFVFGWITGGIFRTIARGRAVYLVLASLGVLACLLPWMWVQFRINGSRGDSVQPIQGILGAAFLANWIVLAAWVAVAFATVATWTWREPSIPRGLAFAGLSAVVGISSFTVLSQPYLPDQPNLYARVVEDVKRNAPEVGLDDPTDLEIVNRGIRQRVVTARLSAAAGPNIEVMLAVMCLLVAAIEVQRAVSRRA